MNKKTALLLAIALVPAPGFAGSAGTTALPVLELGQGARGLAMGNAYSVMADGASSLSWNPAGLTNAQTADVTLNHQPLMKTLNYDAGAVAWPAGENNGFGFGYAQLKSNTIDGLDASGNSTGSFDTKDQVVTAGGSHVWNNNWTTGLSGKWIRSSLANVSASAWALDGGINSPTYASGRLQNAFVLQNLGGKITYDQQGDSLPLQFKLGTLYRPVSAWRLELDAVESKSGTSVNAGTEYEIPLLQNRWSAFLRAGYTTVRKDLGQGLALGGGLNMGGVQLDLAWVPQGDLGSSEIFTLSYRFSGVPRRSSEKKETIAPKTEEPTPRSLSVPVQSKPTLGNPRPVEPYVIKHDSQKSRVYVIQPGDTLGKLAVTFYGDKRLWKLIYLANKHLIDDPADIPIGQRIIIPQQ